MEYKSKILRVITLHEDVQNEDNTMLLSTILVSTIVAVRSSVSIADAASIITSTNDDEMTRRLEEISMSMERPLIPMQDINTRLGNQPPYGGTIFVDDDVITDSDPSCLKKVEVYNNRHCQVL